MTCVADMADDVLGLTWRSKVLSTCSDWSCVTAAYQAREDLGGVYDAFLAGRNLGRHVRVRVSFVGTVSS